MIILPRKIASRRGSSLVEFALVCFQLLLMIFAAFEFARLIVVYTTVANAARIGVRYAIVHGGKRCLDAACPVPPGLDGPSGPGSTANVETVVREYAGVGLLDLGRLTVIVSYPDASNVPGSRVTVTTGYAYDPWAVVPLNVPLGTTTQGVITF
jgi:hypothetical protein